MRILIPLSLLSLLLLPGCCFNPARAAERAIERSIDKTVDKAIGGAADEAGRTAGRRLGNMLFAGYTPALVEWYTGWLLSMAFNSGGYEITTASYKPGAYTRWAVDPREGEEQNGGWLERAFLFKDSKGNEWWQVKFLDQEGKANVTMEALFTPSRKKLLRLRRQFPEDKSPIEVAVTEQNYYYPPRRLTKESLKGGTVGMEKLTVPAGTWQARHVRFASGGNQSYESWIVGKQIPGGVAKYVWFAPTAWAAAPPNPGAQAADPSNNVTLVLEKFGAGARSDLGIVPD